MKWYLKTPIREIVLLLSQVGKTVTVGEGISLLTYFRSQIIQKERERSAKIVEEMMEDSEHWQPIASKILGRTIIRKEDIHKTI